MSPEIVGQVWAACVSNCIVKDMVFTDEGDLVLDPFVGSGTTLRVAQRLGRHSVGVEIHDTIANGLYQEFWEPLNDHVTDYVRLHTDVQAMLLETKHPRLFSEVR